jgi:hypothetical protein
LWPFFIEFVDKGGKVPELLIFWIKNILIPYWIGGNAIKPLEKVVSAPSHRGRAIRDGAEGKD